MADDVRAILKALEKQGFTVDRTKKGHYRVRNASGQVIAIYSGTPSDWRGQRNFIAQLRRYGFIWPPPR